MSFSKIVAKHGVEILAKENGQRLKALVSDLMPPGNETAAKLKMAMPCGFSQIILDSDGKSDNKKEMAFKESVDKIVTETEIAKEAANSVVKLVALSLDWDLEKCNVQ